MKTCFKCGTEKPLSEFYPHPRMADGRLGKCKDCTRRDVAENREKRIVEVHAYDRDRYQRPERKAAVYRSKIRRMRLDPTKDYARKAVARALKSGRLVRQPCFYCGAPKVEAHHDDYSRPLDVRWACFKCHREREHGCTVTAVR